MSLSRVFPIGHDGRVVRGEVLPPGKDPGEESVQRRQQVRAAPEVAGQRDVLPPRGDHLRAEPPVHLDVRAAETVDRLLRVPHDEEAPGGGDGPENLRLQGVRVLELVHEHVPEPLPEPPRDRGIPREKAACPQQQVHEVQPAPLRRLVRREGRAGPRDEEARRRVPVGDLRQPFPEPEQRVAHLGELRPLGTGEHLHAHLDQRREPPAAAGEEAQKTSAQARD